MCVNTRLVLILAAFLIPGPVHSFEPVSALDDAFAIPVTPSLAEGILHYPGSETLLRRAFFVLARSVPFGVEELAVSTAAAGVRIGRIGVSFSFSGTGFDLYGDEQEKAGFGVPLNGSLSAGARLTRTAIRMKGFGETSAWSADLGAVWRSPGRMYMGVSIEDISRSRLGESGEPLESCTRAFLAWAPSGAAKLFASAAKARRFNTSVTAGCMVEVSRHLFFGAAAGTEPERIDYLAAVSAGGIRFSYRGSFHRELGFSHGFSLSWGGADRDVSSSSE